MIQLMLTIWSLVLLPLGFPYGSAGKESTCNARDLGLIPGLGRSPGEGKGYPLQYSGLENSMDCIVYGVAKSWTQLSYFHFGLPLPFLNPACTSGSSWFTYCWSLAWRILSITLLACEMNTIVWQFEHSLAFPFFGTEIKTGLFPSCGHCWVFEICWHIEWW